MRNRIVESEGCRGRCQENTDCETQEILTDDVTHDLSCRPKTFFDTHGRELGLSFQRQTNFDNGAFDRPGRYESRPGRQNRADIFSQVGKMSLKRVISRALRPSKNGFVVWQMSFSISDFELLFHPRNDHR
jgi:hypothetical protein